MVDLYLPDAVKVTPSGVQTTVGSGLNFPVGIALDGAGDVFIADRNNRQVVEVTPVASRPRYPSPDCSNRGVWRWMRPAMSSLRMAAISR